MDYNAILAATCLARKNWSDWQDVFEHSGPITTNPLFAERRFGEFCRDYSVGRTIRKGTRDDFRELRKELPVATKDDTGRALDKLESRLRERFSTGNGERRLISVVSKTSAFVRPERFVAWDRFAKQGANIALGRGQSLQFHDYAEYLAAFDRIWNDERGEAIREYAAKQRRGSGVEREPRFLRRVLDVHLMILGGRQL